jgi:hypothetical protein
MPIPENPGDSGATSSAFTTPKENCAALGMLVGESGRLSPKKKQCSNVVTKFLFFRASKIVLAANAAEKNP